MHAQVNEFFKRTAGLFVLKRTCGIQIAFDERIRAESIIHAILFLCAVFCHDEKTMEEAIDAFIMYVTPLLSACRCFFSACVSSVMTPSFMCDIICSDRYDRACDLEPCWRRLSEQGKLTSVQQRLYRYCHYMWPSPLLSDAPVNVPCRLLKYLVDKFHVNGHKEPKCLPPSESDASEFHYKCEAFAVIRKANSNICEQSFREVLLSA